MRTDESCIEVEVFPMYNRRNLSVRTYEQALRKARSLSNVRALSFHEVLWAHEAPAVEKLTNEWQATKEAQFRVSDQDIYHRQRLELMGLGDFAQPHPPAGER